MIKGSLDDTVKNSRVYYMKCRRDEQHEGEVLNFVCVQEKCPKKGLICPVCRLNEHDSHKVMPLKILLSQLKQRFCSQTSEEELNSLSDYLRTIDTKKKEMLSIVRESVHQIAEKVKKLQTSIIENYNNIRRLVLTQSTIAIKLPGLINTMLSNNSREEEDIYTEFQKYAELLHYDDGKTTFLDNSKKLVEDYANLPGAVTAHLSTLIPELTKIFDSLPLNVQSSSSTSKVASIAYTFSDTNKNADMFVSNKLVSMSEEASGNGGYAFVNEGLGVPKQKIAFKITNNGSGSVTVGMGLTDIIKAKSYSNNSDSDSAHGAFVISSMGITFQHKQIQKQENEQSFVFAEGDVIEVQWDDKTKKINFSRRNGLQKFTIDVNLPEAELAKLQFMVGLLDYTDSVQIIE